MSLQRILVPLGLIVLLIAGYRSWGWGGVALVGGGIMLWLLLHFSRFMFIVKRAGARPLGYVGSAVMLNAKLKRGQTLMHVVALTRSFGTLQSPEGEQPEVYRWKDNGDSWVDAAFVNGRLQGWDLHRP